MPNFEHSLSMFISFSQETTNYTIRRKFTSPRAIFLDRDGTLNIERGYITEPADIELYPGVASVLKILKSMGFLIIIITNQSAIEQSLMTSTQCEKVNQALWNLLKQSEADYDALYCCPHMAEGDCKCRKPEPGLILRAGIDFDIDLYSSYMIGDKLSDIEAGQRAGCQTILVRTGLGKESEKSIGRVRPNCVKDNLAGALAWICEHEKVDIEQKEFCEKEIIPLLDGSLAEINQGETLSFRL